jgi:bacteriorhodopsin
MFDASSQAQLFSNFVSYGIKPNWLLTQKGNMGSILGAQQDGTSIVFVFLRLFSKFYFFNIFFIIMILKIIFKNKKYIILKQFQIKNLKNDREVKHTY